MDDLFEEQRRSRKVFSGYVYQAQHLPVRFMDRCGIWPTAVSQHLVHSGALFAQGAPFDRVAGSDVIKSVNESDLVLVDQDADFDFEQIQVRRKEACLLRGTNGAQQEVFLGRQSIEKVKKHFSKDKYESFLEQTEYECGVFAFPYAEKTCYFNPSIVRNDGKLWLFSRRFRHDLQKFPGVRIWDKCSDLAIWQIREKSMSLAATPIVPEGPERYDQEQWEDPRVMKTESGVYVSFATWVRHERWSIRQSLVRLDEDWTKFEVVSEPNFGGNSHRPQAANRHEKNWCWFFDGSWKCVYAPSPHLTFELGKGHASRRHWKSGVNAGCHSSMKSVAVL